MQQDFEQYPTKARVETKRRRVRKRLSRFRFLERLMDNLLNRAQEQKELEEERLQKLKRKKELKEQRKNAIEKGKDIKRNLSRKAIMKTHLQAR